VIVLLILFVIGVAFCMVMTSLLGSFNGDISNLTERLKQRAAELENGTAADLPAQSQHFPSALQVHAAQAWRKKGNAAGYKNLRLLAKVSDVTWPPSKCYNTGAEKIEAAAREKGIAA
jgi:hypothetical protein